MAASYGEEDVAEAWNSCVRLSCLEHGVTVHTAFDLVTPYPEFNPRFDLGAVIGVFVAMIVLQGEPQARRHRGRQHGQSPALF